MVLNNSIKELIYKNNNVHNFEYNLKPVSPITEFFDIKDKYLKNMAQNITKIIELKKKKKKKEIIVEKEDIHESDNELPDVLSDTDSDYEQNKSDISYVEPVKDDKLTIISGDIDGSDIDGSDIDIDEDLDEVVEDLDGDNNDTSTVGGTNMDNLLFSCLERIHKKGGGTNSKPNLTQNFPKENYDGGANIKKIKLTEKYDFF